jgi:hypothetical protein
MIDLHLHSKHSDGKLSIEELAEEVSNAGINYCSLNDHDSIDGLKEMKILMDKHSINFVNGIEFSVLYKKQEIHVLVYDFDIKVVEKILKERNQIVSAKRKEELVQSVDLFKNEGFEVSDDLELLDKKPIGLLVALDVYGKKKNQELMIEKHGHLLDEKEFYDYYQAPGRPCHVEKSSINLDWLLTKLEGVKCDKILAHPFVPVSFLIKPLLVDDINYLIARGLNGVEVYHDRNTDEQIDFLRKYVDEKNLLFTGGSDYHGKKDNTPLGFYGDNRKIPAFKLTNHQS